MSSFVAYSAPSADWVSVSFPTGLAPLVLGALRPLVSDIPGVSALSKGNGWVFPSSGRKPGLLQSRARSCSPVAVISASGVVLSTLRSAGVWPAFLRVLSSDVHRLTRLDVALMCSVDAPPLLEALYSRASSGGVALTRKALDPVRHVSRWHRLTLLVGIRVRSTWEVKRLRFGRGSMTSGLNGSLMAFLTLARVFVLS